MRSDLLSMIGVSRGASLDEIIFEAQRAEDKEEGDGRQKKKKDKEKSRTEVDIEVS